MLDYDRRPSPYLNDVQACVLKAVAAQECALTLADLCARVEATTRYARYTAERATLELVENNQLTLVGQLVLQPNR